MKTKDIDKVTAQEHTPATKQPLASLNDHDDDFYDRMHAALDKCLDGRSKKKDFLKPNQVENIQKNYVNNKKQLGEVVGDRKRKDSTWGTAKNIGRKVGNFVGKHAV